MNNLQMAQVLLSQSKYQNPGQTVTAYGTATSDSENGLVMVDMGGRTVSSDEEQSIECETTFKVYAGDTVMVSLVGADGGAKTPTVTGVVGRGDEVQTEIDGVTNYFWTNERGAHVSTVERSVEGGNVLLDADSLDIRVGESNSEDDQTVIAKFGRNVAYVAGIDGTKYWNIRDLRDYTNGQIGITVVTDVKYGNGLSMEFSTDFKMEDIVSVEVNGVPFPKCDALFEENCGYALSSDGGIYIWTYESGEHIPIALNDAILINYTTADDIFSYDEGIRSLGSNVGLFSKVQGYFNTATGAYSKASGYRTEARGFLSSSDGYNTVASGKIQSVYGRWNVEDKTDKHALIVGNGFVTPEDYTQVVQNINKTWCYLDYESFGINDISVSGVSQNIIEECFDHFLYFHTFVNDEEYEQYCKGICIFLSSPFDYDFEALVVDSNLNSAYGTIKANVDHFWVDFNYDSVNDVSGISSMRIVYGDLKITPDEYYVYKVKDNNTGLYKDVVGFRNRLAYIITEYGNATVRISYSAGYAKRNNAFNLDWNGNAEFQGEVYLGGCTPNDETPYPALRFNTDTKYSEYFADSTWNPVKFMPSFVQGKLVSDTTNHDIELPVGSICMLVTREYNASTQAYRGHHAYLLYVPSEDLYGTAAIQSVNIAASQNTGVTVTRPNTSILQIKCSNATYAVEYIIYILMGGENT